MHYSIVFTGEVRPGATLDETRRNLAEMFNIKDPALLDRVFSGQRVVLKKGLSEDQARQQEMLLYMAGAACEIKNNAPPAPVTPAPVAAEPPAAVPVAEPLVPLRPRPGAALNGIAPQSPPPHPPLALVPDPSPARHEPEPVPAPLRGYTQADPPATSPAADAAMKITNLGRDGEGFIDPMLAPWDPAFMPDGVRGLSWAGFFAPLLWGTFNGLRLSFLPLLGIRLLRHFVPPWAWGLFYLGFGAFYLVKGRELAWENKQWRNGEHFNRVQRYWTIGSCAFFLLVAYGLVHLTLAERQAQRTAAALDALSTADAAVATAATADAKEAARTARDKVRADYLATIDDPRVREQQRLTFAEQDRDEAASEAEPSSAQTSDDNPPPSN